MQPRPSLNRELLIAIAVGLVPILALVWILLANDRGEAPPPTLEPTASPFDVSPSKTRTALPSATPTLEEAPPTATGTSPASYPGPPAETPPTAGTLIAESQPAPPAPDQVQPFLAGKYDDTHPKLAYDRHWTFRMNSGTAHAYKGTLHVSDSIGNELSFRFTGQGFYVGYQRGRNFGTVTVVIDDQSYSFHEQAFGNIWHSPQLSAGTHSVKLIHENGESINLDYIVILG